MIIDSHQHFWEFNPVRDSWIDDTMQAIRKDFLPQDLQPILKENQVDGCIAVQANQSETENDFLLNLSEKHPFIKGIVGWVDLKSDNIEERLNHFSQNKAFKGVRHVLQAEENDFALHEDFQNGISKLSTYNLTYDILVFPKQLPAAIKLVQNFPNQTFILDHIAKPQVSNKLDETWANNIKLLAQNKNVSCKISGMVTEATGFKWQNDDFTPFLDVIFENFGVDRILYGSDWPVSNLAATYTQVLNIVKQYISSFSDDDKSKIMGKNAIKIYNL